MSICPAFAFLTGAPGPMELIVIFLVILVLFGPRRLPEIAKQVGKALHDLRRASEDFKDQVMSIESEVKGAVGADAFEADIMNDTDEDWADDADEDWADDADDNMSVDEGDLELADQLASDPESASGESDTAEPDEPDALDPADHGLEPQPLEEDSNSEARHDLAG